MSNYILCVDPSSTDWGYTVFEEDTYELVDSGTFRISPKLSPEKRLYIFFTTLDDLFYKWQPKLFLTEKQFGLYTDLLIKISGICGAVAGKWDCPVRYIAVVSWKKWGCGKAKASKLEVQVVVKKEYPELEKASEHVCDSAGFMLAYKNNKKIATK